MRHDEVLTALRRIVRAIDLHSRALEQDHGLTGPQLLTLRRLEDLGSTSVGRLADALALSQPTVTGIVTRLERRGLVERRRSSSDRRRVIVTVTPAGREMLARAPSPLQSVFVERFESLEPWEQHLIVSSLHRVVAMMEAREIEASPILAAGPLQSSHDGEPSSDTIALTESGGGEPV